MITRIHNGKNMGASLGYNYNKVYDGKADVLEIANMVGIHNMKDAKSWMEACLVRHSPIKRPVFSVSLNPAMEDLPKISNNDFKAIADEYMDAMGYGNNPYIVFKHRDIDRTHIHIVAVRVNNKGKLVSDSNEKIRSANIRRRIERKYNLVCAEDRKESETNTLNNIIVIDIENASKHEKLDYIRKVLKVVNKSEFYSFQEYNQLLGRYRIVAQLKETNGRLGMTYHMTDENGKQITNRIKASAVSRQFSAKALIDNIETRCVERQNRINEENLRVQQEHNALMDKLGHSLKTFGETIKKEKYYYHSQFYTDIDKYTELLTALLTQRFPETSQEDILVAVNTYKTDLKNSIRAKQIDEIRYFNQIFSSFLMCIKRYTPQGKVRLLNALGYTVVNKNGIIKATVTNHEYIYKNLALESNNEYDLSVQPFPKFDKDNWKVFYAVATGQINSLVFSEYKENMPVFRFLTNREVEEIKSRMPKPKIEQDQTQTNVRRRWRMSI